MTIFAAASTKKFLMDLPPKMARHYIEDFELPTPYKEILIAICILRLKGYAIESYLDEEYKIKMPTYTIRRNFKKALAMFRVSYEKYVDN